MKFNELTEEDRFNLQYKLACDFDCVETLVHFLLYGKCSVLNKHVCPDKRYNLTVDIEVEDLTRHV